MNARLKAGLGVSVWLSCIAPTAPLAAQTRPACVEITLPEGFARSAEWHALIALETSAAGVLESGVGPCAAVEVVDEGVDGLSISVSYQGHMARSALALDDVLEVHHARVAALVAQALLRTVVDVPADAAVDEPAAPAAPGMRRDPEPIIVAGAERPDRTLHLLLGTRVFLGHLPALGRAELLAQWTSARLTRVRYAAGLVADLTTAKAESGRVIAGSFGLRMGVAFRLLRRPRTRLWLGPSAEASALITVADSSGSNSSARALHFGAASADFRLSAELVTRGLTRPVVSLDIGGVLRALRLRAEEATLVTYAGVYAGFGFGVALGL